MSGDGLQGMCGRRDGASNTSRTFREMREGVRATFSGKISANRRIVKLSARTPAPASKTTASLAKTRYARFFSASSGFSGLDILARTALPEMAWWIPPPEWMLGGMTTRPGRTIRNGIKKNWEKNRRKGVSGGMRRYEDKIAHLRLTISPLPWYSSIVSRPADAGERRAMPTPLEKMWDLSR